MNNYDLLFESVVNTYRLVGALLAEALSQPATDYLAARRRGDTATMSSNYPNIPVKASRQRARQDAEGRATHGGGDEREDTERVLKGIAKAKATGGKLGPAIKAAKEVPADVKRRRRSRTRQATLAGRGPKSTVVDDLPDEDYSFNPRKG